jgi:hypothetical protein
LDFCHDLGQVFFIAVLILAIGNVGLLYFFSVIPGVPLSILYISPQAAIVSGFPA